MPLLFTRNPDEDTTIGIWSIEEDIPTLKQALPPHIDISAAGAITSSKRQREWLASRVLVYKLLADYSTAPLILHKNTDGKPVFDHASLHVSISHSPELVAVILSQKYEVGIDIEMISEKALRVASKFLTAEEEQYTANDLKQTCLYWSAKETLYKIYSRRKLLFKENLMLSPAQNEKKQELLGKVHTDSFSKLYTISYEFLQNHVLTYSIDKLIL